MQPGHGVLEVRCGTHKTVTTRLWPCLSGKRPYSILSGSLFARKRRAHGHAHARVVFLTDFSKVDSLGLRYKSVNFEAKRRPSGECVEGVVRIG